MSSRMTRDLVQGMSLLASNGPFESGLPSMELASKECRDLNTHSKACGRQRLHMQLHLPAPAFYGAMNFSGDLRAWSFTDIRWPDQADKVSRVVRFAGSDGSEMWNFWVMLCFPTENFHRQHTIADIILMALSQGNVSRSAPDICRKRRVLAS